MRVLILTLALMVTGCITTPDFWTCPKENQKNAAEFLMKCETEFSSIYCRDRMREVYCIPGYKEQLTESTEPPKRVVETTTEDFMSSPLSPIPGESTQTNNKKGEW